MKLNKKQIEYLECAKSEMLELRKRASDQILYPEKMKNIEAFHLNLGNAELAIKWIEMVLVKKLI